MSIGSLSFKNSYSSSYILPTYRKDNSQSEDSKGLNSLRENEYEERMKEKQRQSVVDQGINYANQLKSGRAKSKESSLEKKKLQYSFKRISSQIVRSKNSSSARRAASAAKREVMRLKRLKGSGEYDDEELQLAIDHAKAMEQVAKKKVHHLEQEEMIERSGKGLAQLEEVEKDSEDKTEEEAFEINEYNPEIAYIDEYDPEIVYIDDYESEMASLISQDIQESVSDAMPDLMEELNEEMAELMEELDLTDLAETMYAPDPDMSEDDLKKLKIKHRGKEMKEIAEADKEYLKGIMELQKNKPGSANMNMSSSTQITPVMSVTGMSAGSGMAVLPASGGFDISI